MILVLFKSAAVLQKRFLGALCLSDLEWRVIGTKELLQQLLTPETAHLSDPDLSGSSVPGERLSRGPDSSSS